MLSLCCPINDEFVGVLCHYVPGAIMYRVSLCTGCQSIPALRCRAQAEKARGSDGSSAQSAWKEAQQDYAAAAASFQRSRNLPGSIFASSNAALMSAQLGNDSSALRVRLFAVPRSLFFLPSLCDQNEEQ